MTKMTTNCSSLVKDFKELFEDTLRQPYSIVWGRDQKIFKTLLELYPDYKIREALKLYFTTDQDIYSPVFFKVNINELLQKLNNKPRKLINPDADRF